MSATPAPLAPCAYRRVFRGQTYCSRATDELDQAVWPEVCARCPVPTWLQAGVCRHLDVGTEVARKVGDEGPRVYTACRFFHERLEGLERCRTCPEFALWDGQEESTATAAQRLARSVPLEALEEAVQKTLDRHVERASPRTMTRCFRAGVERCIREPRWLPNHVLVLPPASLRPAEPYRGLVAEVLKRGGLEGLFFLGPLKDVDALCDLCLAVQQCLRVVIDLSEWDAAALFALGLAGALGREMLLVRGPDATPPFVPQGLPVYEYSDGQRLAMILVGGLGLELREEKAGPESPSDKTAPESAKKYEKTKPGGKKK